MVLLLANQVRTLVVMKHALLMKVKQVQGLEASDYQEETVTSKGFEKTSLIFT